MMAAYEKSVLVSSMTRILAISYRSDIATMNYLLLAGPPTKICNAYAVGADLQCKTT